MTQIKWKKISQYCIESNNLYISRYKIASGANRYALWHNSKLLKINDNAQELKNEAMAIIERESGQSGDLFGKPVARQQTPTDYNQRKG